MSVSIISRSASILLATSAERRSLSPNAEPISSVDTQSFSFITGRVLSLSRVSRAFLRFRYVFRLLRTSAVSRTCAIGI